MTDDTLPLAGEAAAGRSPSPGPALERDRVDAAGVVMDRGRAEGADGDLNAEQSLVEEVSGNPGGSHVFAWWRRLVPTGTRVDRIERNVPSLIHELHLREDRNALPCEDGETDLDTDRTANVCRR
jgi:hypothetical protein